MQGYKESPLSWDKGTTPEPINWYAGKQYDDCFGAAHQVLDNFDKEFPHWKGRGYEIEGFAWWQGDKDRYVDGHAVRYEKKPRPSDQDLASGIQGAKGQVRRGNPRPNSPKMLFPSNDKLILDAQLAVDGATGKYPEFKGNVSTVYTHPLSQGGASNSHYDGNAQTYMDVGVAMGEAMVELLK